MMKKRKFLFLCAVISMGLLFATGCGNSGDGNGTEAPYEDETNRDVNETQNRSNSGTMNNNGMNNNGTDNAGTTNNGNTSNQGTVEGDLERCGDSLKDAGRNLMDSVQETGDALRDGIDNLGNDMNNTNNTGNADNANNANNAGGTNTDR